MERMISDLKTATMTFHMAYNYGAMLQAYALQKTIEKTGADCEILDYRLPFIFRRDGVPRYLEFIADLGIVRGNIRYFWRCLNGWSRRLPKAKTKSDSFMRNDLKLSKKTYFRKNRLETTKYDAVVFGSDQIWNPDITGGFADEYLGQYFDSEKTSLIAYAASCGKDHLDPDYRDAFLERLRRFSAVSVREKSLARTMNESYGIPAMAVLDPVLLADPAIWDTLTEQAEIRIDEPYLLLYSFDAGDGIYQLALQIAQQLHLKPVAVCYRRNPRWTDVKQLLSCGPKDFLSLLRHASFVCTTSFHGLAFSILWEKNFYCMGHPLVNQRERDLLDSVGMRDRYVEDWTRITTVTDCDYSEARTRLAKLREDSQGFLENALKKAAIRKFERQKRD